MKSSKSTWEEEFDEKLQKFLTNEYVAGRRSYDAKTIPLAFIRTNFLPLSTLHTLEEKIRGMKKRKSHYAGQFDPKKVPNAESSKFKLNSHNAAIDSVLQEIGKIYEY